MTATRILCRDNAYPFHQYIKYMCGGAHLFRGANTADVDNHTVPAALSDCIDPLHHRCGAVAAQMIILLIGSHCL